MADLPDVKPKNITTALNDLEIDKTIDTSSSNKMISQFNSEATIIHSLNASEVTMINEQSSISYLEREGVRTRLQVYLKVELIKFGQLRLIIINF